MEEGVFIDKQLDPFNEIIIKFENMEVEISDEGQVLILLCSLPSSYAHFVDTLIYGCDSISMEIMKLSLNLSKMRKRIMKRDSTSHSRWETLGFVEDLYGSIMAQVLIKWKNQGSNQKSRNRCNAIIVRKWAMLK